ncbi:MAG: lipocalin family protein [Verrucomicrobiota bacterium]
MGWLLMLTGALLLGGLFFGSCRLQAAGEPNQPLADFVDLDRFMGVWYVHGFTPTAIDKDAFGGTETYELSEDGKIQTTYAFRKGGPDGKAKKYRPVARIVNEETNAEWRMTFFGVIKSAYYVVYVDPNYEYTVIGHPNKRMAWVMSRETDIEESRYLELREELVEREYDLSKFVRMEH